MYSMFSRTGVGELLDRNHETGTPDLSRYPFQIPCIRFIFPTIYIPRAQKTAVEQQEPCKTGLTGGITSDTNCIEVSEVKNEHDP
jgi:hypothetical protein